MLAAYAPLATSLQVPPDLWPADRDAFDEYWRAEVAGLHVTDEARQVAHDLFHPVVAPLWLRAALPLASLVTAVLLPPDVRAAFGLPWNAARARRADAAFRLLRVASALAPRRLREWPARHYLGRLRSRDRR